jgi:uncharacterized protein (TIGR01777 family)
VRVLVTGATGFVGKAVTARLLEGGNEVIALSRDPKAARARLPERVQILPWKSSSPLPAGIDAVIHLAGASIAGGLWTASRKKKLWASRVDGTRALIESLAETAERWGTFPSVFVTASGMGYHGRQPEKGENERTVHPDGPPGSDFLGRLAAAWEGEAKAARKYGARVVCVRLGMVLGTEGGALPPQLLAFRLGLGAVLGTGRQYWPWIGVGAAAELFVEAVTNPGLEGAVHAAAGAPLTQREFAKTLGRALGRPVFLRIPVPVLRFALGEMADLFLHGQKVESVTKSKDSGGSGADADLSACLREMLNPSRE